MSTSPITLNYLHVQYFGSFASNPDSVSNLSSSGRTWLLLLISVLALLFELLRFFLRRVSSV